VNITRLFLDTYDLKSPRNYFFLKMHFLLDKLSRLKYSLNIYCLLFYPDPGLTPYSLNTFHRK
jgi:hypothetical protein